MLTAADVECSSHRLLSAVRAAYVTETAAALRADGWIVTTRPAPGRPRHAALLTVETGGRAITFECSHDVTGAWSWHRRSARPWQCPADRIDAVLAYVQAVSKAGEDL